jgi:adenosine kinase
VYNLVVQYQINNLMEVTMNIIITGSLAFDRIMNFQGKFEDNILPESIHKLNVSFTVFNMNENFGGTAGNIAYALSLLGESPKVIATVGRDFESYSNWLIKHKIPIDGIKIIDDESTAGAYITTDSVSNQITVFNLGAMKFSTDCNIDDYSPKDTIAIIAPGNLDDMLNYSRAYKQKGIGYIFDPGQTLPILSGEQLTEMITGSKIFISNDYELELTIEKTSLSVDQIIAKTGAIITTKAEHGCNIITKDGHTINVPSVKIKQMVEPTGAGDAFRAGLIKGLIISGNNLEHAVKLGATSAAYCVETTGTQHYSFTINEYKTRFKEAYGVDAF